MGPGFGDDIGCDGCPARDGPGPVVTKASILTLVTLLTLAGVVLPLTLLAVGLN